MLEVYKIMHGIEKVEEESFFSFSYNTRTRSHLLKSLSTRFRTDQRRCTINEWHSQPQDVH